MLKRQGCKCGIAMKDDTTEEPEKAPTDWAELRIQADKLGISLSQLQQQKDGRPKPRKLNKTEPGGVPSPMPPFALRQMMSYPPPHENNPLSCTAFHGRCLGLYPDAPVSGALRQ